MQCFKTACSELLVSGGKHKLLNPSALTTGERNKYITNRPENKIVYCLKNVKDLDSGICSHFAALCLRA